MTAIGDTRDGQTRSVPGVEQLRAAWTLIADGWVGPPSQVWRPAEVTVLVAGCHGGAGASTVAVAIATATDGPARVVECADPARSGLAGAATAEFGVTGDGGWAVGTRDQVTLCRRLTDPRCLPPPPEGALVTVVDAGAPGVPRPPWLREWAAAGPGVVVLVTTASTYGMRHLEVTAESLPAMDPAALVVAVRGPDVRRWPKGLPVGPVAAGAREAGRLVVVPQEKPLTWAGLETGPVPGGLLAAAREICRHVPDPMGEPV